MGSLEDVDIAMSPHLERPMASFSTLDDVTTINYALDWPHLETPSNTTFAGLTQIDICHCPRTDLSPRDDTEPGHMYTRFECEGPNIRFRAEQEDLWVLEAPHGPINMLRPATEEEKVRRRDLHNDTDPAVYEGRKLLFLTGPCPRGRYQAYATQRWLQTLTPEARKHVSYLCILVQPYEEDCSDEATRLAYAEITEYLTQHVPALQKLYLHICPEGNNLCTAASEFSGLLRRGNTRIVVVDHCETGESTEYGDPSVFLDAMAAMTHRVKPPRKASGAERGEGVEGHGGAETSVRKEEEKEEHKEDEGSDDDDWTEAGMSPTSPQIKTDKGWQLL